MTGKKAVLVVEFDYSDEVAYDDLATVVARVTGSLNQYLPEHRFTTSLHIEESAAAISAAVTKQQEVVQSLLEKDYDQLQDS